MRARMNKEKVGVCLTKVVYKFVSVSCTQQVLRYLHMKIVNVLGALTLTYIYSEKWFDDSGLCYDTFAPAVCSIRSIPSTFFMPALDVHWIWDALNFLVSFSLVLLATRRTLTQEHNVAFFINFLFSFVYLLFCMIVWLLRRGRTSSAVASLTRRPS